MNNFASGLLLPLWTLFSVFSWPLVEAQHQITGPLQPITAHVGEDVILPCSVQPGMNVQGKTIEWSRPDLKPDPSDPLSRVRYVHLYRGKDLLDRQIELYTDRTSLFKDTLMEGNISLKITNVSMEDEGRYRCFIPNMRSQGAVILLSVGPSVRATTEKAMDEHVPSDPTDHINASGDRYRHGLWISAVVFVAVLIVGFGLSLKMRCQDQTEEEVDEAAALPEKQLLV